MSTKESLSVRARRELSDKPEGLEFRLWRRFAKRYRQAYSAEYPWKATRDGEACEALLSRVGWSPERALARIDEVFDRGEKLKSILALVQSEDVREGFEAQPIGGDS